MTAAAIIALLEAVTSALPAAIQLANEFKATASANDQAAVNVALAAAQANATAALNTAVADLDAAS